MCVQCKCKLTYNIETTVNVKSLRLEWIVLHVSINIYESPELLNYIYCVCYYGVDAIIVITGFFAVALLSPL